MSKKNKQSKHELWADTVWVEPFNWKLMLVTPSSFAKFKKHLRYHKCGKTFMRDCVEGLEYVLHGGACFYHDSNGNYIMFLGDEYEEENVWHECLHAATRMWGAAGAELKMPRNDEVLTYTQGYIVRLVKARLYPSKEE